MQVYSSINRQRTLNNVLHLAFTFIKFYKIKVSISLRSLTGRRSPKLSNVRCGQSVDGWSFSGIFMSFFVLQMSRKKSTITPKSHWCELLDSNLRLSTLQSVGRITGLSQIAIYLKLLVTGVSSHTLFVYNQS